MTDRRKAVEIAFAFRPRSRDFYERTLDGCMEMAEYKNNQFREIIEEVRAMVHSHRVNPEEYEHSEDYNDGFTSAIVAIDKLFNEKTTR